MWEEAEGGERGGPDVWMEGEMGTLCWWWVLSPGKSAETESNKLTADWSHLEAKKIFKLKL